MKFSTATRQTHRQYNKPINRLRTPGFNPFGHRRLTKHAETLLCCRCNLKTSPKARLFYMAVREGLTKTHRVFCPTGSLRSVQTAPGGLSNPARVLTLPHLYKQSLAWARLFYMAVREGFEPSNGCPLHAFQACAFSHSATSPYNCKKLSKRPFCEARILHKSHAKRNGEYQDCGQLWQRSDKSGAAAWGNALTGVPRYI